MKNKLLILLLVLCSATLSAQHQVIASSGNYFENSSASIAFTVGELAIATFSNDNNTLTQGFHQFQYVITAINELCRPDYSINVFPNPVTDYVILKIGKERVEGMYYELFDINGNMMMKEQIDRDVTEIPFSALFPSVYFLKVLENSKEVQTFKIVKQ